MFQSTKIQSQLSPGIQADSNSNSDSGHKQNALGDMAIPIPFKSIRILILVANQTRLRFLTTRDLPSCLDKLAFNISNTGYLLIGM